MERLTDNSSYCTSWTDCPGTESRCKIKENCYDRKMYEKLRFYEDLEEHIEKVYGEHDGLLETVVKSLVKYNGEKPRKSRLLTDEDADKWEMYKDAEEQGLLIRLPCKYVYYLVDVNSKWGGMVMKKSIKDLSLYEIEQIDKRKHYSTREEAEAALERMKENA